MNALFLYFETSPEIIRLAARFTYFRTDTDFIRLTARLYKLFNVALHEVSLVEPLHWKVRWMRNIHKTCSFIHRSCMGQKCS